MSAFEGWTDRVEREWEWNLSMGYPCRYVVMSPTTWHELVAENGFCYAFDVGPFTGNETMVFGMQVVLAPVDDQIFIR